MDTVEIWVEVDEKIFSDEMNVMSELKNKIKRVIETTLGIGTTIKLVEPKTIARSEGKSKRVIDRRSL
jgi:phenylacetate-CoA ligase